MNIYVGVAHFHKNDEIASDLIVRRFSLVVEHLTCNQKVLGSNPRNGFSDISDFYPHPTERSLLNRILDQLASGPVV